MKDSFPLVKLRMVLTPVDRPETPVPGRMYRQIGVRLWGEGAYERESIDGGQTRYGTLSHVEADDIIVNKIWARNGSVAVVPSALAGCYASGEFPTFIPDRENLETRWFHWMAKTPFFWNQCDEKSRGTSGKNRIRPENFLSIEVPLPSLNEQHRILGRIEKLAAVTSEARALRRTALEEAEALFEQTRAQTFVRIAAKGTQSLSEAAVLERGRFSYRPRNDPRFFGGRHPWIQIAEIERSNKYIREWSETLNDDGLAISKKFSKGTVLVSIAATIGAVGILDFDCCVPDSIVGVTPRDGVGSEYLYHYLGYIRTHLESVAPQSAQKNINLRILSDLPIPKIGATEQRRVIAELDGLAAKMDTLRGLQVDSGKELDALMPSILSKAFAGEL